ncbi:MAG: anti-sigma factor antagonist [Defluviitaleaceae bacterium]|nr:anti-sigma factor antagonist [Defluviitaleaceae bacterium]
METSLKILGQTMIVVPIGDIDHHTSIALREKIDKEAVRENIKNILFDFSNVEFMDSSGIGLIIGRYKLMSANNGITAVCHISDSLRRIFDISGLKKIVHLYGNLDEAINQIQLR